MRHLVKSPSPPQPFKCFTGLAYWVSLLSRTHSFLLYLIHSLWCWRLLVCSWVFVCFSCGKVTRDPPISVGRTEMSLSIWQNCFVQHRSFVALQLCPPLQFGPLTYQPIEWGFTSSNQSALWSCLLHVTSQLGEGCSMSFVRFSVLIVWKTCVWNSFGAFSLMGFWRILQKFEVCSKLSSVNAYFHMLES